MISIIPKTDFLREHMFNQFSNDSILSRFFINAINEKTDHDHYLLFHSENDRRIPMFFNELFCECFDPSINSTDIIMHLFYTIMAELINVYEDDLTKGGSYSHNSLLKKYTGMTYIQLIQAQKLQTAANLLKQTTLPVTEIAQRAGYENVTFFYKKFQEKYHCQPGEYRG